MNYLWRSLTTSSSFLVYTVNAWIVCIIVDKCIRARRFEPLLLHVHHTQHHGKPTISLGDVVHTCTLTSSITIGKQERMCSPHWKLQGSKTSWKQCYMYAAAIVTSTPSLLPSPSSPSLPASTPGFQVTRHHSRIQRLGTRKRMRLQQKQDFAQSHSRGRIRFEINELPPIFGEIPWRHRIGVGKTTLQKKFINPLKDYTPWRGCIGISLWWRCDHARDGFITLHR